MSTRRVILPTLTVAVVALALLATQLLLYGVSASAEPTCSGTLGIETHGQHIVGDYITGIGHENLEWPPAGGVVGAAIAGEGAGLPGGPGPGFHFPNGFAPGASFCLDQSQSPGFHPGP